jgi:4-amino-4-deoxy-L-arabinose transferase-like glycosyltransferase
MLRKAIKRLASIPISRIILFSLIIKMIGFFCLAPWNGDVLKNKILVSDQRQYDFTGKTFAKYGTFAPPQDTIDLNKFSELQMTGSVFQFNDQFRVPGYFVFVGAIYKVFGMRPYVVILFQIFLSLISIFITYRICLLFGQREIGTIAALLYALDLHSVFLTYEILTETLFVLLFLIAVYYFFKGLLKKDFSLMMASSLFLGLSALTRGVLTLYPAVIFFMILFFIKADWIWKLKTMFSYSLIFIFLMGLWSYRNHKVYNSWQLTTEGGFALAMYNAAITKAEVTHQNPDSVRVKFQEAADSLGFRDKKTNFEKSDVYSKIGLEYISKHKLAYAIMHTKGAMNMFLSLGNVGIADYFGWTNTGLIKENFAEISKDRVLKNFSNAKVTILGLIILIIMLIQYLGMMAGFFLYRKIQNNAFIVLTILSILYFAAITGIYGMYRYKLPLTPLICIMAAYAYCYFAGREEKPV